MSLSPPDAAPPSPTRSVGGPLFLCFLGLAAAICGYSLWVGPVAFQGDSYLFADRAKHLFYLGNLDLNNNGTLVYPPLYSIVLAPCYAFADAARIVTAITLLNSLFVASAVFPLFKLVSQYAGVSGKARWFLTLLIAASPAFVTYAPMVLSEAFYVPLVYWTAYAVFRSLKDLTVRWFVTAGLLMAVGLLCRSAATALFLGGFGAWLISLWWVNRVGWGRAAILLGAAGAAVALPLLLWHWIEQNSVTYQGRMDYSITDALRSLAANRADQLIKLQWAANAVIYFLTAPLNLGAFLVLAILAGRPATAWRDPLIPFAAASIALAIASIVILASTDYGGGPLTWNKYFAPYLGLVPIIALRLRGLATAKSVAAALALAFVLPWIGRPSGLSCHFPDSLTPFINSALPLPVAPLARDLVFFLLIAGTTPLLVPFGQRRGWYIGAGFAAGLCLLATAASARLWRNSGLLNLARYDGLAVRLIEAAQRHPGYPIYYDPEIALGDRGEALRCLFYYPRLLPRLPRAALFSPGTDLPANFFYLTRGIVPSATLLAAGGEHMNLFRIDGRQIRNTFAYRTEYGQDVGGQEAIPYDGRPTMVRWLGSDPTFKFQLDQAMPAARLGLRLAAAGRPRTVSATLNGERLREQPVVQHVLWNGGFDYVEWNVALRAGENILRLECDSAPITLPDGGRKVTFLLLDEPVMLRPPPASP